MTRGTLHRLVLQAAPQLISGLEDELDRCGYDQYSSWEEAGAPKASIAVYFRSADEASAALAAISLLLDGKGLAALVGAEVDSLPDEQWEESWKRFFHLAKVSRRVVVGPSWEEWRGDPALIRVTIDPGMSFGTGLHATTRACISFIDDVSDQAKGGRFLDAGCGSGILSICAAKLGFNHITALDLDPIATECAERNLAANGVRGVDVLTSDLAGFVSNEPYDLAAVNILEPVIRANAGFIARLVRPQTGRLILAGLLSSQFDGMVNLFANYGFELEVRLDEEQWSSGLFKQSPLLRGEETLRV